MTDKELVELVETTMPEELTLEQIELIRRRLRESPALREALAGQLQMDQYLATVIGNFEVSPAVVMNAGGSGQASVWTWLGWAVCLLMVGFVASMLVWPMFVVAPERKPVAEAGPDGQPSAAETLENAHSNPASAANPTKANTGVKTPPGKAKPATAADHGKPGPAATASPAPAVALLPWQTESQLGGPPRPIEQIAFDRFDRSADLPALSDFNRWFTPIAGGHADNRLYMNRQLLNFDGALKFNAPWAEDNVLRLSLIEFPGLAMHFWKGKHGTTVRFYPQKWTIAAYATDRDNDNFEPKHYALTATDDGRNWNTTGGNFPLRIDLRFHAGELTISHGDLVLLRAPFDGLPTETVFQGHSLFDGLAMVRATNDWPAEPDPLPVAVDITKPAEMNWHGDAQPGAAFTKLADGSVQLTAEKNAKAGYEWFDLPKQGLYEVIVELDNVSPNARLAFGPQAAPPAPGQPVPEPVASVSFFHENRQAGMSCKLAAPTDVPASFDVDVHGEPAPLASGHQWLKLIAGGGLLKCYVGVDGVHWARIAPGEWGPWCTPIRRIGLYCGPGDGQRTIRLRRAVMREFHEIDKLAPAELLTKAPAIKSPNLAPWLLETLKTQPPGVGVSQWQRACAVKTLAENYEGPLGRELILALIDYALGHRAPMAERLALMHEAALLTNVNADAQEASKIVFQYQMLGEQLARDGEMQPWSLVAGALDRAPLWSAGSYPVTLDPLARRELVGEIFAGQIDNVADTLNRLRLMNLVQNPNDSLMDWADDWLTVRRGGVVVAEPNRPHIIYKHPYIEDLSKEGFSLLSEFDAALDSQAYKDACQIITSAPSADALGLMPDTRDSQLLVSLAAAVDGALAHEPALRDMMSKQFGPIGLLQVHQAINEADAAAVAGVTIRYRGTEAAAEAFAWLGDRALSAGDFGAARVDYRLAGRIGGRALAARVAPRDRLAAAMTGEDVGQPPTAPVRLGDMQMPAAEFESIVAEMRKAHATSRRPEVQANAVAAVAAPAPTGFEIHELAKFDGEVGNNPANVSNAAPSRGNTDRWLVRQSGEGGFSAALDSPEKIRGLDWVARQMATAADSERVYVSNRFQTCAFESKTGKRLWQSSVGGEHGETHEWTLTPMRPLPLENRVFVRRLTQHGPELVSLDKANGLVQWRTPSDLIVASDPVWSGDQLVAIVATHVGSQWQFNYSAFDFQTGARSGTQPLATLRDSWFETRVCQLATVQENFVMIVAGTVVCFDPLGKVRWVRRQEWLSPHENHDWGRQYQQPALVVGDRLLVTQPGVEAVECLDASSGLLYWRKALPGIHRMTGVSGDRLIVETDDGLLALSVTKGKELWHHDTGDLMEAQLCGGPGQIVFARRARTADNPNQSRPMLVWLDSASGQPTAHTGLESLRQDQPMFGPLLTVDGRLWAFSAANDGDPNRTLYELVPHGAAVRVDRPEHVAIEVRAN